MQLFVDISDKAIYICIYKNTNDMKTTETPRFEVKTKVKFGMICGYYVYDNQEKKSLAFDFDEDELYKAQSRAELSNALNK